MQYTERLHSVHVVNTERLHSTVHVLHRETPFHCVSYMEKLYSAVRVVHGETQCIMWSDLKTMSKRLDMKTEHLVAVVWTQIPEHFRF